VPPHPIRAGRCLASPGANRPLPAYYSSRPTIAHSLGIPAPSKTQPLDTTRIAAGGRYWRASRRRRNLQARIACALAKETLAIYVVSGDPRQYFWPKRVRKRFEPVRLIIDPSKAQCDSNKGSAIYVEFAVDCDAKNQLPEHSLPLKTRPVGRGHQRTRQIVSP
jgi:hypothetical protein